MKSRRPGVRGWSLAALMLVASPAAAHDLKGDVQRVGDVLEVRAFYPRASPAADAAVEVRDSAGGLVASGRTDGRGRWTFASPGPGKYQIVIDAGDGHRKEMTLTVADGSAFSPAAIDSITAPAGTGALAGKGTRTGTANRTGWSIHVDNRDDPDDAGRFPWLKAALGVAAIAGLALGLWLSRRKA